MSWLAHSNSWKQSCSSGPVLVVAAEEAHSHLFRAPQLPYSIEAAAGALISVGALRSVPLADMEDCILRQWATGKPRRAPVL